MCHLCQTKPVYEFTNKRKVCGNCFVRWFQKKVFYTIRKFEMLRNVKVVGYDVSGTHQVGLEEGCTPKNIQKNIFTRGIVLENVLKMIGEKGRVEIRSLQSRSQIDGSESCSRLDSSLNKSISVKKDGFIINNSKKSRGVSRDKLKISKIAVSDTTDLTSYEIVNEIVNGDVKNLREVKPVDKKIIKPLYFFLDKEVLLYAKLKGLKIRKWFDKATSIPRPPLPNEVNKSNHFLKKQDKIPNFINELETKHPEVKWAIVKGMLNLNCIN